MKVSFNGKILLNADESDCLRLYLSRNTDFHKIEGSVHHSWPCSVWENKITDISFEILFSHGIVPRNFYIA